MDNKFGIGFLIGAAVASVGWYAYIANSACIFGHCLKLVN